MRTRTRSKKRRGIFWRGKKYIVTFPLPGRYNLYSYSFIPSPRHGLNSGLMLMDLEKMRRTKWREKVLAAYATLQRHLAFVDQVADETGHQRGISQGF